MHKLHSPFACALCFAFRFSPDWLLCAFAKSARAKSRAGRRLSQGEHSRGRESAFEPHHWSFNTAVGYFSLGTTATSIFNTANGAYALRENTTGGKNTATEGISQFGLVAEEVEKVNPDLVVRDKEGKPTACATKQVNAMLLNEFLKEHRKVEEQEATIAQQQKQIEALTAGLQKVSAQLEAEQARTANGHEQSVKLPNSRTSLAFHTTDSSTWPSAAP